VENNPITDDEKAKYFNKQDLEFFVQLAADCTWSPLAILTKKARHFFEERLSKSRAEKAFSGENYIEELKKSPHQIAEKLPAYLGMDIVDNLEKNKARLLLFADTFEALAGKEQDLTCPARRSMQKWFVDLCAELLVSPKTAIVMAGRDRLDWSEFNEIWKKDEFLEQHLINPLSRQDADSYLEKCGVDESLFTPMYEISGGVPLWLGVLADYALYFQEKEERKLTLKDMGILMETGTEKSEKALEQLLSYMTKVDAANEQLLTCLSLCRSFTSRTYEWIAEAKGLDHSFDKFDRIARMTFVYEEPLVKDGLRYHPMVRALLSKKVSSGEQTEIHSILYKKYMESHEGEQKPEIKFDFLCNAVFHQMCEGKDWRIFDTHFNKLLNEFALEKARELLDWVPDSMRSREYFFNTVEYGDRCVRGGRVSMAFEAFISSHEFFKSLAVDPKDAQAQRDLSISYAKCGLYDNALATTSDLLTRLGENSTDLYQRACIHARMSKPEMALTDLRKCLDLGYCDLSMEHDMDFVAIKDHPEFVEILGKMKEKMCNLAALGALRG
jgi:tetratricopeptide (TPR) repeat protein